MPEKPNRAGDRRLTIRSPTRSGTADLLVRVAHTRSRQQCVRTVLGLVERHRSAPWMPSPHSPSWPRSCGLGGQPQVWRVLAEVQEAWAADPQARARLDAVLTRAQESLAGLGGLSTVDYLVSALAPEGGRCGHASGLWPVCCAWHWTERTS